MSAATAWGQIDTKPAQTRAPVLDRLTAGGPGGPLGQRGGTVWGAAA